MSTTAMAPAGWYPNPLDAATQRWWDGTSWTEHVAPIMAAAQMAAAQEAATQQATPATAAPAIPSVPWAQTATGYSSAGFTGTPQFSSAYQADSAYQAGATTWKTTVESPNTVWIWLLAFGPYISGIGIGIAQGVLLAIVTATSTEPSAFAMASIAGFVLGLVPVWVFAGLDIRTLRQRGYQTASILFMLLVPPLVYFAARGRMLRRDGVRSRGPEIAFLIVIAVNVGSAIIGAVAAASLMAPLR